MNPCFTHSKHQILLEQVLEGFHRAAIVTTDGHPLLLKYETLADIGTLPAAAVTGQQYLPLQAGEIIISNDPYSGGSVLSSMTLLLGLSEPGSTRKKSADFLLSMRLPFKPQLSISETVEDEGLRIPPSPLFQGGQINSQLVEAISQHPAAPFNFKVEIEKAVAQLINAEKDFKALCKHSRVSFAKPEIKQLFKTANELTKRLFSEISVGENLCEYAIDEISKIKLKLDITDDKAIFDFTGSDSSSYLHLTDTATLGACVGALVALFDRPIPLNAGVFEAVEVLAPAGTLVNSKYPNPVFLGMTDGTGVIANMVLKSIGLIDNKRDYALSGVSQCSFDIKFSDGGHFYETLDAGLAASANQNGVDGLSMWKRSNLEPCLEEVERRYPVEIQSYAFRSKSGGRGEHEGGDGITKAVKVTDEGVLKWMIAEPTQKPEGIKGGLSASTPEIYIHRKDSEREKLPHRGELNLRCGDIVTIHSAGGGGFGEEVDEE